MSGAGQTSIGQAGVNELSSYVHVCSSVLGIESLSLRVLGSSVREGTGPVIAGSATPSHRQSRMQPRSKEYLANVAVSVVEDSEDAATLWKELEAAKRAEGLACWARPVALCKILVGCKTGLDTDTAIDVC